jgi:hypothetical protein
MLNQRTIPRALSGEGDGGRTPDETQLPDALVRWADRLRDRGLGDAALILTELLKVWGFAGSQILWMLAPFLPDTSIASMATVLESPEMLDQMRTYLEGDLPNGQAKERSDD